MTSSLTGLNAGAGGCLPLDLARTGRWTPHELDVRHRRRRSALVVLHDRIQPIVIIIVVVVVAAIDGVFHGQVLDGGQRGARLDRMWPNLIVG